MSTIVCLKEGDTLVLGTDSRRMKHDFSGIESDAVDKIFELGPGAFLAPMGWNIACDFQAQKARELARNTTDVRVLAWALDRESRPVLWRLFDILRGLPKCAEIDAAMSGQLPFHRVILAGYSGGELGWICQSYTFEGGEIVLGTKEWFGTARKLYVSDGPALRHLAQEPATWRDDPVAVVARLLAEMRCADSCVGGPDQILVVDVRGARWIRRLPTAETPTEALAAGAVRAIDAVFTTGAIQTADIADLAVTNAKIASLAADKITAGTIDATVRMTSPEIVITGSPNITIKDGIFEVQNGTLKTDLASGYVQCTSSDGAATLDGGYLGLAGNAAFLDGVNERLMFSGQTVVRGRLSAVGSASTSHSTASFSDVNTALNALGTKINDIVSRLGTGGHGLTAD